MKGTEDTVTEQVLAMSANTIQLDRILRMATTMGHYSCSAGKNPKVVKLLDADFKTKIEINERCGDYYGTYYYHWIDNNKVYLQLYLRGFSCGEMFKIHQDNPETFVFTEEEFEEKVYIHRKPRRFNMESISVEIQEIIKRHEDKGFTRTDAIMFYNKVTMMINRGAITKEEGNKLLKEATIDCIG